MVLIQTCVNDGDNSPIPFQTERMRSAHRCQRFNIVFQVHAFGSRKVLLFRERILYDHRSKFNELHQSVVVFYIIQNLRERAVHADRVQIRKRQCLFHPQRGGPFTLSRHRPGFHRRVYMKTPSCQFIVFFRGKT